MDAVESHLKKIAEDGFDLIRGVYAASRIDLMAADMERALQQQPEEIAIRSNVGGVFAARNVLALWPEAATVWRQPPVLEILAAALGPKAGLVRGLYFDKPPERTWALPWHKDLTIAVRDNRRSSTVFSKPTVKAGVPHVEAPRELLENMLTVRIHLDEVTEENGPLKVLPGSHLTGKGQSADTAAPVNILAGRGDVLLMRPLLAHASNHSSVGTLRHRRILHLEFAGTPELPDGYRWFDFRPL